LWFSSAQQLIDAVVQILVAQRLGDVGRIGSGGAAPLMTSMVSMSGIPENRLRCATSQKAREVVGLYLW
jgi:hypothetical protein